MSTKLLLKITLFDEKNPTKLYLNEPTVFRVKPTTSWSKVYRKFISFVSSETTIPYNHRIILYFLGQPISSCGCVEDLIDHDILLNLDLLVNARFIPITQLKVVLNVRMNGDDDDNLRLRVKGSTSWKKVHRAVVNQWNKTPESIVLYYNEAIVTNHDQVVADILEPQDFASTDDINVSVPMDTDSESGTDYASDQSDDLMPYECKRMSLAYKALKKLQIPSEFYQHENDRCYCANCHRKRHDQVDYYRGDPKQKYVLPIGWSRFGLKVDEGKCKMNSVWNSWHVAYHGSNPDSVHHIFKSGLVLLKPGDLTITGDQLGIKHGHIKKPFPRINKYSNEYETFDPNQVFISPSIKYAGSKSYAPEFDIGTGLKAKCAFQLRIRPGSYTIGHETIGATKKGNTVDTHFNNNELEWYTKENVGIVVHGLLIKVFNSIDGMECD
eukprot:339536_1